MMDWLEYWDHTLLLVLNHCHSPFMDHLMWWISSRILWVPFYLLLLYLAYLKFTVKGALFFLFIALLAVAVSDLISVHLFKNIFLRYRPSHHLFLKHQLHFYRFPNGTFYRGGMYGFVSSHATNFGALLTFSWIALKKFYPRIIWLLLACGSLVCYSRVYLGVHYPSDVFVGFLIGALVSFVLHHSFFDKVRFNNES